MPSYLAPVCFSCSKFNKKNDSCSIYPNGIPRDIYFKGGSCKKASINSSKSASKKTQSKKAKSKTKKKRK